MIITIHVSQVYGRQTIYPGCKTSQLFADLAGTISLTPQALAVIKKLGYEIKAELKVALLP